MELEQHYEEHENATWFDEYDPYYDDFDHHNDYGHYDDYGSYDHNYDDYEDYYHEQRPSGWHFKVGKNHDRYDPEYDFFDVDERPYPSHHNRYWSLLEASEAN